MYLFKNLSIFIAEATGTGKPVPYKDLKDGSSKFIIYGLPEDIHINDPSCYGTAVLNKILQCKIKFVLRYIKKLKATYPVNF